MAITQAGAVKTMPYLLSNLFSLGTCFIYALVVLVVGAYEQTLFQSKFLSMVGMVSYEIYLVHSFTLSIIDYTAKSVFLFLVVTTILAVSLHEVIKRFRWI